MSHDAAGEDPSAGVSEEPYGDEPDVEGQGGASATGRAGGADASSPGADAAGAETVRDVAADRDASRALRPMRQEPHEGGSPAGGEEPPRAPRIGAMDADERAAPPAYRPRGGAADERQGEVPAALELSYTSADLGLSPRAYERAFPYERTESERRRRTTASRARRIGRELVETVVLALLIFLAVKAVLQNFRVEGSSMEPSLRGEQYLLVNKAIYFRFDTSRIHDVLPFVPEGDSDHHLFRAPHRGDVVVFRFPLDPSRDFIKRVIGEPGDTVEIRDETVFINGSPLKEDYIQATPNYQYAPKTVPPREYFVLGDNRRNSFDSHAWGASCSAQQQCDFVPEGNIIGQAWISYWPFDMLGFVNNESVKPRAP